MMFNKRFLSLLLFFLTAVIVTLSQTSEEYYTTKLDGKKDRELKKTLHLLLKDHIRIPYGSSYGATWTVFRQSDVRPDGSIWDMYSSDIRYFPSGNGSNRAMNIEHSAPKSWWGETSNSRDFQYDASFDLHHLVPSDADANMAKSNYILGEVQIATFNNGVSKVGTAYVGNQSTNAFEPADQYKGDFARMYLYIVTCYQDYSWASSGSKMFQSNEYPTLTSYGKDLLLKWHRQDPVSEKELVRNNAVYSFQENRNPYIDYPELVEYIWGDKISQEFYLTDKAHLLNYKPGDRIVLPDCLADVRSVSRTIKLQGQNFKSNVSFNTSGSDFLVSPQTVTASQLNEGVDLVLSCAPTERGLRKSILTISNGGLTEPVNLELRCLAIPEQVNRVVPIELNPTYSVKSGDVPLLLNQNIDCVWSGEGVAYKSSGYVFEPAIVGVGEYFLYWSAGKFQGKVKIKVY